MKTFNIFWNDLTEECQQRLYDFLGVDNGNYDVFPLVEIESDEDEDDNG